MQSNTLRFGLLQLPVVSWLKAFVQLFLSTALLLTMSAAGYSQALTDDPSVINDHMFPALPAAKPFSDFDSKGFLINGKRTFLVSAGIEYARVPHELWEDRLLRLKRGGFNCVEIYTIWNFHEPLEGKFDFSADRDLDGFLTLVKKLGMYAIVRVGPYYCAEWDQGGYPIWLRFKPGLRAREPNAQFEKYVDRYFDHLLPVVFKHQISKGGSIVLIQLENEHPKGWGTIMPDQYFKHLQDKALSMGMEIPYFFSGVHHSTDPAGNGNLDDATRPNPWFSTEYWSMWYTQYGAKKGDAAKYDRSTWKIIANGGNGYNIYMAHGGSNFGYTNNDEDAASYDYGAAVGQAGDLRPLYYTFKRAAYFARSFGDILENSTDGGKEYQYLLKNSNIQASDTAVRVAARTSAAGNLIFLNNAGHKTVLAVIGPDKVSSHLKAEQALPQVTVKLKPGEIYPLVHHFKINSAVMLDWALSRVYGVLKQGGTTTILVQAEAGEKIFMRFLLNDKVSGIAAQKGFKVSGNFLSFHTVANSGLTLSRSEFSRSKTSNTPSEYSFMAGAEQIRILVMDSAAMDHSWFTENPGINGIVTGVPYLGKIALSEGRIVADIESPLLNNSTLKGSWDQKLVNARIYLAKGSRFLKRQHREPGLELGQAGASISNGSIANGSITEGSITFNQSTLMPVIAADFSAWTRKDAALSATPDYDDSKWLGTENPLQMGGDQDITADAWYRTKFSVAEAGKYSMQAEGGDRGTIYIDGKTVTKWKIKTGEVSLNLDEGKHTLAIFTAHNGRDKMAAYLGPIVNIDKKGLDGKILLRKGGPFYQTLTKWYFKAASSAEELKSAIPVMDTLQWKKYKIGADAFDLKEGFGWFATVIPAQQGLEKMTVAFKSVDENATVFINGKEMIRREGWNIPFEFTISDTEVLNHEMVLTVFVENHDKEGGIDQPVKINTIGNAMVIKGWKMRGGPDEVPNNPASQDSWTALNASAAELMSGPKYYHSSFTLPQIKGIQLIWRLNADGLGHGSVWINGHHIGRYPELNGKIGMYIPESWLKDGSNELLIYEEEGNRPSGVTITTEQEASRNIYQLVSDKITY